MPRGYRLGETGARVRPNYQVEFEDGTVQAYFHGGAPHPQGRFDERNLGPLQPLA